MRIFISYARVDKPYCTRIVEMLDIHDVWYDYRMYVGDNWWREIVARLHWCDVFIYLLSTDSLTSKYCREEFEIALGLGKKVLPVLIEEKAHVMLPPQIQELQYADLTEGLTPNAFKVLFNALYIIEKESNFAYTPVKMESLGGFLDSDYFKDDNSRNVVDNIGKVADAMDAGKFDQALFLLQRLKQSDSYTHVDLEALVSEAELGLEEQTRKKRIDIEYRTIAELIRRKVTRRLGCQALQSFKRDNPDYDPEQLTQICLMPKTDNMPDNIRLLSETHTKATPLPQNNTTPPLPPSPIRNGKKQQPLEQSQKMMMPDIEWVRIPAGVTFGVHVDTFYITKYPITNEQFDRFIQDPRGYRNETWWKYSVYARDWFRKNPRPRPSQFPMANHPRENVSWYEAIAFCNWLSAYTRRRILLPNQAQWRRAASGDDDRLYPWGAYFDPERANTRSSGKRRTTPVDYYPSGQSPYGVHDLAGNTWEWCLNATGEPPDCHSNLTLFRNRALLGGSWNTGQVHVRADKEFYLEPNQYYVTIGFRVVMLNKRA